ncbi:MAG: type II toxin-antitoxin system HipA family toxin [Candidatus Melainabacteria bacterium]|nr:type II toxin-antitoxin system HipA family toxin [Candidatus Melainabacteria bacterium]
MTIFIGTTAADKSAIRAAASRGALRRIARDVYTDDFESRTEQLIQENLLAILGKLQPDWHLAHSTAATLSPIDGLVFLSGYSHKYVPFELPGVKVIRSPDLTHPEVGHIEAPTMIAPKLSSEPELIRVNLSSPLQTVFECISTAKRYPQKLLPEHKVVELIGNLSAGDREHAGAFAIRNNLKAEHWKYLQLCKDYSVGARIEIARINNFAVYFYGWEIGNLTALQSNEFRFEYAPNWHVALSSELPLGQIYESRRMPAFFENLLPEGWTESQLQATFKIAREDTVALLATTQKYLSNLTLRTSNFDDTELVFDTLNNPLSEIAPAEHAVMKVRSDIAKDTSLQDLFRNLGKKGPMRISGIQPKLPISLVHEKGNDPTLTVGTLRNSCSYILKYQSPLFPNLVENEWATMELARRVGLPTAAVRQVEFRGKTLFPGRALLIERYDIPGKQELDEHDSSLRLALQQDAASLLKLYRQGKYDTSAERVADVLMGAGLSPEQMELYLKHLLFSWMVGNGDLHAKNVSIIIWLAPGQLGATPAPYAVAYSPLYDLVNTRIHLPGDRSAFSINGKNDRLKVKDFAAVAARWGVAKAVVSDVAEELANGIRNELRAVLDSSGLSLEQQTGYSSVVKASLASMQL